jgi:hypothetical protein
VTKKAIGVLILKIALFTSLYKAFRLMQINVHPISNIGKNYFLINKKKKRKYVQFTAPSVRLVSLHRQAGSV